MISTGACSIAEIQIFDIPFSFIEMVEEILGSEQSKGKDSRLIEESLMIRIEGRIEEGGVTDGA